MSAPRRRFAALLGTALGLALVVQPLAAQPQPNFTLEPTARPEVRGEVPLGTPTLTGRPAETWDFTNGNLGARNVVTATITPFLPPPGTATGAAVVVAPGGAFLGLSMDAEGYRVARWLADRGVAAFVLKYRLLQTPADFARYKREMTAVRTGDRTITPSFAAPRATPPEALEDGLAAIRFVRAGAAKYGIDPARVGFMGFSAGAMTTMSVALAEAGQPRPAFIAPIYGSQDAVTVPADAPPLFIAIATDDFFFAKGRSELMESWVKAKRPVEMHLFQNGGHGFATGVPGTSSFGWLDSFHRWLGTNGLLTARP